MSSDRHIWHKKIIEYDNRPFADLNDHDQAIIDSINETVGKDDVLINLGDVFLCSKMRAHKYLSQINCKNLYIIPGNHDWVKQMKLLMSLWWNIMGNLWERPDLKAVFCHYPIEERRNKYYWWKHYHGHSHHKSKDMKNRMDVGLDFAHQAIPVEIT